MYMYLVDRHFQDSNISELLRCYDSFHAWLMPQFLARSENLEENKKCKSLDQPTVACYISVNFKIEQTNNQIIAKIYTSHAW